MLGVLYYKSDHKTFHDKITIVMTEEKEQQKYQDFFQDRTHLQQLLW